ncbi:MAG: excinuclease ABC subunit UvrC [Oscillospiraceae bacterium]|nr:excinuclease ABC subunit UvrC [Oscillospiraceae bacterium]
MSELREKVNNLPQLPGVYLMKDIDGQVIYIGKAVRLKSRVSSYFNFDDENPLSDTKTGQMISKIADFDFIAAQSEFEALLLENSLIKELLPKYNIKLRDDKGFPVIRVDIESDYPTFKIVSNPTDDAAIYLGPYGGRQDTRKALFEVSRVMKLPTCSKKIKNVIGKERACLNFDMGNCPGYCQDIKLQKAHREAVISAIDVFQGKTGNLIKRLTKEMEEASKNLKFELAAVLRDRVKAVEVLSQKQFFKEDEIHELDALHKEKVLKTHLWLSKALGLEAVPERIEAFDISNTGSSDIVGSMVVFVRGKPYKKDYRHFKIKTRKNQDDYGSMAEVVSRRIKRYLAEDAKFSTLPDIMLIDGGANHAAVVKKTLDKLGVELPVFGMVKDEKHRTRALVSANGDEIGLAASPAVFALIGTIQEEAHRFAVEYHRKLRSKTMLEGK